MITKNEYLIAQAKLHELRQQRTRLLHIYGELEQRVELTPTEIQQLRTLFTSLQRINMARIPLHTDVANLEPLLNGMQFSEETLSFWRERLAKELPQGRLRSELIYIFGALLEEWVQERTQEPTPDPVGVQMGAQLLEVACQPAASLPDLSLLDALFGERNAMAKELTALFQQCAGTILQDRITVQELTGVLTQLSTSSNHSATIRRQAKSFLQDSVMCKEMAEALSIVLTRLNEWDWPEEGVSAFPVWTMNKWRLFITYDLFTMCFLEVLGLRLQNAYDRFLVAERMERQNQLRELLEEPHENQETLLQQSIHLYRLMNNDVWVNLFSQSDTPLIVDDLKAFFKNSYYSSIVEKRQWLHQRLRDASTTPGGYKVRGSVDGWRLALQFIHAEIQLARTAFPQTPFYVLKLDLKNFYPSLSHELLLKVLEFYGFSSRQLAFFRKFLQVRVRKDEEQVHMLQGVPHHHRFSHVLAEMVLHLLDQHLLRSARVQIIRLVDDFCILTPVAEEAVKAWQAAQQFCQSLGLTLNAEKCGAVSIGGELPDQLPASLPTWLLLQLNQNGEWEVASEAFATYLEQARRQVLYHPSLLTRIETYNLHVDYLIRAMAMEADLGETHRRSIAAAAAHFHTAFFREGHGMVETLRQEIQQRFLDNSPTTTLPEAWFYWPITAGGCGLTQIMILVSSYAESHSVVQEKIIPTKRSADWQKESNDWLCLYSSYIRHIQMKEPKVTKGMEILVKDFIHRGNELGNSEQTTLGAYWQWILYIYGPQILDRLGTFRFLSTELVPLQIILQHYQHTLSFADNDPLYDIDEHPF